MLRYHKNVNLHVFDHAKRKKKESRSCIYYLEKANFDLQEKGVIRW